jgi:O-antigen ligase
MQRIAYYLLLFLVFTIPWQNVVVIPMLGTISRLAGFAVVGIALLYVLIYRRINEPSVLVIVMVLFVLWSFLSYSWSIRPPATFGRFVTNFQLIAMAWLVWELCRSDTDRLNVIQSYILGAFVSIGDMVLTYTQASTNTSFRIAATGFDPNDLASTLALGIPLSFYLLICKKRDIFYLFNLTYIPLALFCIVLTASRGGIIVAAIALSVVPFTFFKLKQRDRFVITSFIGICILFVIMWLPNNYEKIERNIERITETPDQLREGNLSYRQVIWKAGWRVFRDNPINGVGAAGFRQSVSEYLYQGKAPHNTYLSIMVDMGLVGIVLFLSMLIIAIIPNFYGNDLEKIIMITLFITLLVIMIPLGWEANKNVWLLLSFLTLKRAFVLRSNTLRIVER